MDQVLVSADDHIRYCAGRARQRQFEQPPGADRPGTDRPPAATVTARHGVGRPGSRAVA
ncbi:hypothetical protein [Parafrankia discariae]|uniref:hypothetical protein n=1 Tax=Parafrankia discariae TaxID=365528 RepID=UPI00036E895C|nr:hypothetical protein [Parafrankia discariae]